MDKFDVLIIGAGTASIFTAYELLKYNKDINITIIEKGSSITKRVCNKRTTNECIGCNPCNITTGFSGAGAFSDGKLSLSTSVGGDLPNIIGQKECKEILDYCDNVYLKFGANNDKHGMEFKNEILDIRRKAIQNNLNLIDCPIRHLGTDGSFDIYNRLEKYLIDNGVKILFNKKVCDLIIDNKTVKGVYLDQNNTEPIYADIVISAIGREGSYWFEGMCEKHHILRENGNVDIGVRVEVRNEIMQDINKYLYESKLIFYTNTFDDKVRVFCSNPSGEVSTEYYKDNLAVVNGHAYSSLDKKTDNTNFALLVSHYLTEPFKSSNDYGMHIAKLSNMLAGGNILVQRFGDFKRGRRTTKERLDRNNVNPTLIDAVPGDISLVLPYRTMKDIEEMIYALDKIIPGIAADETLLYGIEVKFYANRVKIGKDFQTNIKGLYAVGDGSGWTRGLMMAACSGVSVARNINELIK